MPVSSCRWCRKNTFSCISLMRCVIPSKSVNIVGHLKCVIPCSPDAMGYIGKNGGGWFDFPDC